MQQQAIGKPLKNGSFTRTNGAPSSEAWPRFFMDTVEDVLASERAGRPIFREEERVELNFPGNPHSKPVSRVTDEHRQKYEDEYEAFKRGQETAVNGTPLEQWSVLKRSQVLELKALGFMTIEHIRDMNDHAVQRIPMYGRRLKQLAEAYLDDAAAIAQVTAAHADSDRKDAQIAALELQVTNMQEQMQRLFASVQDKLNTPNPLLTNVPGMSDPMEATRFGKPQESVQSSFADLPEAPRRRGRPPGSTNAPKETPEGPAAA